MLKKFAYVRPGSLKEALKLLSSEGAKVHAGGTDLLGCLREQTFEAKTVVSISGIDSLRGIKKSGSGGLRIGALTTITEVAENPELQRDYTALARAASEVASPQLRNQGTIGGNICQKPRCWYYRGEFHCLRKGGEQCFAVGGENAFHCILGGENCFIVHPSDTAPALAALGAKAHIAGPERKRSIPLESFFVSPAQDYTRETVLGSNEIVTDIELPPYEEGLRSSYRKVRARRSWDFALAGVALALVFEGEMVKKARVYLSGVAPVPWRAEEVEDLITGKKVDADLAAKAGSAAVQEAAPLEQNAYKIFLTRGVVEEELQAMARAQGKSS
jgi:xanthine dehydrogenase YagS FAD-binding subunit